MNDPFIGAVLEDRYEIRALLGAGGMGTVYKARHKSLDRDVAVKILHPQLSTDPKIKARFAQEIKIMSTLAHPNLINIQDYGLTGFGTPFLVMEYLECLPLSELLKKEGPLSTKRTRHIGKQIATALAHAHEKGIVHRDLKPANILIVEPGKEDFVKIVDLGIAKLISTDDDMTVARLTQTGEVFGSPLYMSPEQCTGQIQDHRVDIYSLGCILYEMLTGVPPFRHSAVIAIINSHLNSPIPTLASGNDQLSVTADLNDLEELIRECLQKNAHDRLESMESITSRLSGLSSSKKLPSPNRRSAQPAEVFTQPPKIEKESLAEAIREKISHQSNHAPENKNGIKALTLITLCFLIAAAGSVIWNNSPNFKKNVESNRSNQAYPDNNSPYRFSAKAIDEFPLNGTAAEQTEWALLKNQWKTIRIEYPDSNDNGPDLRFFGVYGGKPRPNQTFDNGWQGDVEVNVEQDGHPLILVLHSYMSTTWHIRTGSKRVKIEKIILAGMNPQEIVGVPKGVPVVNAFKDDGSQESPIKTFYFFYSPESSIQNEPDFKVMKKELETYTGRPLQSFEGVYSTSSFTVR